MAKKGAHGGGGHGAEFDDGQPHEKKRRTPDRPQEHELDDPVARAGRGRCALRE